MPKFKLGWPQVVIASVAILALTAIYLLAPEDRDAIEKGVLSIWAFVASFLGPMLRSHEEEEAHSLEANNEEEVDE